MTNKILAGKKVLICGGSIAGCAVAILLRRLGADIVILEKSTSFEGRGAGIVLPEVFIEQCIRLDLFDADIPRLKVSRRSFYIKDETIDTIWGKAIWQQQSFNVSALNWHDIYQQLRKRIPNDLYQTGIKVLNVEGEQNSVRLITATKSYSGDFCIAADGIDSQLRRQLFPQASPVYVNYIAWRGLLLLDADTSEHFKQHIPYYVFPNGHLLLYLIPSEKNEYQQSMLNWVLYESVTADKLSDLLVDKVGAKQTYAMRAGSLSQRHITHLHQFANQVLPTAIANLICQTELPFFQVVFDFHLDNFIKNKTIFIGDAAAVLRPHSASGALKAISDSINLYNALDNINATNDINLLAALTTWNEKQKILIQEQTALSTSLGNALVNDTPQWHTMNAKTMENWWQTVMNGKKWYATHQ